MNDLLNNLHSAWPILKVPVGTLAGVLIYRSWLFENRYFLVLPIGPYIIDTDQGKMEMVHPCMSCYYRATNEEIEEFWEKFAVAFT